LTRQNYSNELLRHASAVLDRIEDGFSNPSDGEQLAQRDALETLSTLRKIAERDTGEQRKTGTYWLG
jgi:hypothetical protein